MKSKHTILTGAAILSLLIITFLTGCGSLFGGGSAAAKVNYVPDGTYTFYPRLREMQGGVDKNGYLDRIEAKNGTVNIYLVNVAIAKGSRPEGDWYQIFVPLTNIILQDLDNPSRTCTATASGGDDVTSGCYFTFQGVTATRFSLTNKYVNPPMIFDEVILGQPD